MRVPRGSRVSAASTGLCSTSGRAGPIETIRCWPRTRRSTTVSATSPAARKDRCRLSAASDESQATNPMPASSPAAGRKLPLVSLLPALEKARRGRGAATPRPSDRGPPASAPGPPPPGNLDRRPTAGPGTHARRGRPATRACPSRHRLGRSSRIASVASHPEGRDSRQPSQRTPGLSQSRQRRTPSRPGSRAPATSPGVHRAGARKNENPGNRISSRKPGT